MSEDTQSGEKVTLIRQGTFGGWYIIERWRVENGIVVVDKKRDVTSQIEHILAAAKAEAWDEGVIEGWNHSEAPGFESADPFAHIVGNPYSNRPGGES